MRLISKTREAAIYAMYLQTRMTLAFRLVDELDVARDPSRTPLFQVVFSYQNAQSKEFEIPGLSIVANIGTQSAFK